MKRRLDPRSPMPVAMSIPKPIWQRQSGSGWVRYQLITATQWRNAEGHQLAVTATGRRVALPANALGGELRYARRGQRLHAVEADGRVLSAWL
jgi:hypothetical protein